MLKDRETEFWFDTRIISTVRGTTVGQEGLPFGAIWKHSEGNEL